MSPDEIITSMDNAGKLFEEPPKPADLPPAPEYSVDPIGHLLHRVNYFTQEAAQVDSVPLLERCKVLALLHIAAQLEQIAASLDLMSDSPMAEYMRRCANRATSAQE